MTSLNDLIWNPEDENLLDPNYIGMREICIIASCTIVGNCGYDTIPIPGHCSGPQYKAYKCNH